MITQLATEPKLIKSTIKEYIETVEVSNSRGFIEANTIAMPLEEIRRKHIVPVFTKDNEPVISHSDFIDTTFDIVSEYFKGDTVLLPSIRLSHPIMGRVPGARNKPANELQEDEKTIYYERMAFLIEIPSVQSELSGDILSLTIGE